MKFKLNILQNKVCVFINQLVNDENVHHIFYVFK